MKKSDIKEGMVIEVRKGLSYEKRNQRFYIVKGDDFKQGNRIKIMTGGFPLSSLTELKCLHNRDFDVVRIYNNSDNTCIKEENLTLLFDINQKYIWI